MINPFKNISDLKQMRDQAMAIQKALAEERITVEKNGIKVVISGDQKIQSLEIDNQLDNRITEAINEAIKKSQEVAARKLQEMSGGLGGLLGR